MITSTTLLEELPGIQLVAGEVHFPVKELNINGNVDGDGVVWNLEATFDNPLDAPAEATFTLPLPNGGAVIGMSMKIGDRVVEADIKEREAARVEYEEAKNSGHTAALLEQERAEIFTLTVGNIHPNESISVTLEIHDRVAIDGTEVSVRFPTMIKPRYNPSTVVDAERINPPRVSGEAPLTATVTIVFAEDAKDLVCETISTAVVTPRTVTINNCALTTDIILKWTVLPAIAQAKWVADRDNAEVGTLEVNIRVPEKKDVPRRRKAVQVMLDVSGSMSGRYEQWARRILDDLIASLTDDDLIHILAFDHRCEVFSTTEHGFVPATRASKQSLRTELAALSAGGGTELTEAFKVGGAALAMLDDREDSADIERIALLITDGAYGDESRAAAHREKEFKGARVIAVGIGENANGFLEVLAANGICVFVSSQQGVAEASAKVMSRVATAAHSHAQLIVEGLTDQAPALAPDIYPDVVVTLSGRMPRPADDATVEVVADDGHVLTLPITISSDASTTTRWAKQHISSLDYRIMSSDFSMTGMDSHDALEEEIVRMSVKYRVLSKYTAWIAVDRSRTTDQVIVRKLVQPQFNDDTELSLQSHVRYSIISPMRVGLNISGPMPSSSPMIQNLFSDFDPFETMAELKSISSITPRPKSEFPAEVLALIAVIDQYLGASPVDDRDQMLSRIRTEILILMAKFTIRIFGKRVSAEMETAIQFLTNNSMAHTEQTNLVLTNLRTVLAGHSSLKKFKPQRRR